MREEVYPCWEVLRTVLGDRLRVDEPMSAHTSWHVGGPADLFAEVHSLGELNQVRQVASDHKLPVTVVGDGTNVLVLDGGVRGLTVTLRGEFGMVEVAGDRLRAGAGAALASCVEQARVHGLTGLEFAAGIPGTIGGAVVGNAGTREESVGDRIKFVSIWLDGGGERVLDSYGHSYRNSSLRGETVLGCEFELARDAVQAIAGREKERLAARRSQPRAQSAGCVFRNPPGESAGRMIDELGLKGTTVGGATVSREHGNFILTAHDGARAEDVLRLIELVGEGVFKALGLELELEVQLLGEQT